MLHKLFQDDKSGQTSDTAIDGQEPHRWLVHCSGRAPVVRDSQGFAKVEQRYEVLVVSNSRAQPELTKVFIARLTCISLPAQPHSSAYTANGGSR